MTAVAVDVMARTYAEAVAAPAEEPDSFAALRRYMHRALDLCAPAVMPLLDDEIRDAPEVHHFMFDPDWDEGCPSCSTIADGFDETHLHLQNHDVAFTAVSRAPLAKLHAYRERMGWTFPWVSSGRSDFNYDFHVTIDPAVAPVEYNYADQAELERTDVAWREWSGEQPGMSAFAIDGGVVYHTYSAYARGFDALWPMWQWLDRAPLGRNEGDLSWFRRHDQYQASYR